MTVVARMRLNSVELLGWATKIKLSAVYTADESDPHYEEIKSFFEATPQGTFEATIRNSAAAEQFQMDPALPKEFYVSIEPVPPAAVEDQG